MQKEILKLADESNISYEHLKAMLDSFAPCMNDYLYVYDLEHDTYSISENALERFKVPSATFHNVVETHKLFVYEADLPTLQYSLDEMIAGVTSEHDLTYRWVGIDGEPIWINCRGRIINGKSRYMIGCINEVGAKQKADNLTGMLGDQAFKTAVSNYECTFMPSGFILRLGLNGYKQIVEDRGRHFGDGIIKEFSECILESVNRKQAAFHMMEDEFLITDVDGGDEADADELYHSISEKVNQCLMRRNYEVVYSVLGGLITTAQVMKYNENCMSYEWINKRSIFALAQARISGKNQLAVYNEVEYERFVRKQKILASVRKAISNNYKGFHMCYQPIVAMGETPHVYGAESLLRFKTEKGEIINPTELVPILEESGLIIPVGNWILNEAFAMCKACQKEIPGFRVSVNVSYVQLLKSPIYKIITEAIKRVDLDPSCIVIEMTESGYLEYDDMQNVWDMLKEFGCHIAIDDFGTGYSNLHSISELKPDLVKIDRSFTLKALRNAYENELMGYTIRMVHSIDAKLVIEGIETERELEAILKLNPDFIQGFYYGQPSPREEFTNKYIAS